MSVAYLKLFDIGLNDDPNVQVESDGLENMDTVQVSHPTLGRYFGSFEMPLLVCTKLPNHNQITSPDGETDTMI